MSGQNIFRYCNELYLDDLSKSGFGEEILKGLRTRSPLESIGSRLDLWKVGEIDTLLWKDEETEAGQLAHDVDRVLALRKTSVDSAKKAIDKLLEHWDYEASEKAPTLGTYAADLQRTEKVLQEHEFEIERLESLKTTIAKRRGTIKRVLADVSDENRASLESFLMQLQDSAARQDGIMKVKFQAADLDSALHLIGEETFSSGLKEVYLKVRSSAYPLPRAILESFQDPDTTLFTEEDSLRSIVEDFLVNIKARGDDWNTMWADALRQRSLEKLHDLDSTLVEIGEEIRLYPGFSTVKL